MLSAYTAEVQNLLNDQQGQFFRLETLHDYINRARRRISSVSGCIRVTPAGTMTVPRQERYPFKHWDSLIQEQRPGSHSILACRSLAVAIGGKWERGQIVGGGWKPLWRRVPYSDFQSRFRIYNQTFFGTISEPGWYSQYGLGPDSELLLAPIPAQPQPMEVDLTLVPAAMVSDDDEEPMPYPWRDAVSYWAATLCLLQQQRREDAQAMAQLFNSLLPECAAVVCPQMLQTTYGGTLRSA